MAKSTQVTQSIKIDLDNPKLVTLTRANFEEFKEIVFEGLSSKKISAKLRLHIEKHADAIAKHHARHSIGYVITIQEEVTQDD